MDLQPTVRILAVDDIESNLVALEAVLERSSISVVRADSGQEALRALLEEDFALILLDVQMPRMDGFETAMAIRQRKKCSRIPIIFLTAHGTSSEKMARAYAVGAIDFLTKPIDEEALRAKVGAIADLWRKMEDTKREVAAQSQRQLEVERERWQTDALRARIAEGERATAVEHAARLQAETTSRVKDEFLSTLSHELRTPLNAILGWATTLQKKGITDPTVSRGLAAIERNAKAQAKLIEDLLDASSVMAGKVRLDMRLLAVGEVVTMVTDSIRPEADRKQVILRASVNEELPSIAGDLGRLRQVLTQLLSNALKFTPAGGQVDLRVDAVQSRVRIEIKDTGAGIAANFLPHVFDTFRQGDGATTRVHGGLGIGLALAQHLIALHGGTIRAESEGVGKGATFTIVLPIPAIAPGQAQGRPQEAASAPSAPLAVRPASVRLENVRVLIVDDEPDAREMAREVLQNVGAQVLVVDSAEAAVESFSQWKPDVIVSDIGMPGQDGYSLIRRIRAMPGGVGQHVPAAALTAYTSGDHVEEARLAGFQAHLAKPVDASKLIATIRELAGRR